MITAAEIACAIVEATKAAVVAVTPYLPSVKVCATVVTIGDAAMRLRGQGGTYPEATNTGSTDRKSTKTRTTPSA